MDRHNDAHRASRVDLEAVLGGTRSEEAPQDSIGVGPVWTQSRRANILARAGLLTSSLAVIAAATLLALIAR